MKKFFGIALNFLPIALWLIYFSLTYSDVISVQRGMIIQLTLLLPLPVFFSAFNIFLSNNKKAFLLRNIVFAFSQIIGCCITGALYYNLISDDSGTIAVTKAFVQISVIYILVITLVSVAIKHKIDREN